MKVIENQFIDMYLFQKWRCVTFSYVLEVKRTQRQSTAVQAVLLIRKKFKELELEVEENKYGVARKKIWLTPRLPRLTEKKNF